LSELVKRPKESEMKRRLAGKQTLRRENVMRINSNRIKRNQLKQ